MLILVVVTIIATLLWVYFTKDESQKNIKNFSNAFQWGAIILIIVAATFVTIYYS